MIIRTRNGANAEVRMAEWGSSAIPVPGAGYYAFTGRNVTTDTALGMPAVSAAIRLISETIASLPIVVYRDKERATDSWQYQLLHDRPNAEQDAFQFKADISNSIEANGNAFIQKIKTRGRVVELHVINPEMVRVRRDRESMEKRFDVIIDNESIKDLTTSDIIHIRGWAPPGSLIGYSPISIHRQSLGNAAAMYEHTGRWWANSGMPSLALKIPGGLSQQQSTQVLQRWNENHGGLQNSGKPALLANGAELQVLPFSFHDAAYIEQMRLSQAEIAMIWRIPQSMLGASSEAVRESTEQEGIRFLRYSLGPRLRRIEQALAHDADLFGATSLYPEVITEALLRPDTKTRYEALLQARQGGWLTANEARAMENYPPVDGGDVVQVTPVGGAPNLQPANQPDAAAA